MNMFEEQTDGKKRVSELINTMSDHDVTLIKREDGKRFLLLAVDSSHALSGHVGRDNMVQVDGITIPLDTAAGAQLKTELNVDDKDIKLAGHVGRDLA